MGVTNDLDEEGHEVTSNSNDTETLLVSDTEDEGDEDAEPQVKVNETAQVIQQTQCEYESGSTEKSRPINIEEQDSTLMTGEVKCTNNLLKYLNRRKTKGKSGEQIKWDSTLDQLQSFVSFVLKSNGKWKQTGKSDKSVKHIFEEKKGSYKLNWWPSSNTINLQGKAEATKKINDKINKIINDNNQANEKGDGKQHTVNTADESFATQSSENSNSGDHEIEHSKPEAESKPKRNNFQKEIKEYIKSLWVTVSQLKEFILTERKTKNAPTTQKETTWNNDSITNSNMISENEIINEGSPKKNNNDQRTHSRSSGKLKDTLITQFLKPGDKNESDIQLERLRKMHELESRCRRLEKEKALLQKELAELQKKVNNRSMITNRTKIETNGQEGQAPGQVEMKSKRKEQQKPKKQQQQHQPPDVQR